MTIVARQVLLDGLEALAPHIDAITVVGAQAVYLRSETAAVTGAAYTSDGDLGIDPALLGEEPLIDEALTSAGFETIPEDQPGLWFAHRSVDGVRYPVELDLLVGSTLARGRRSARIPPHSTMSARIVPGLDTCAVDRSPMVVRALDPQDLRRVEVNVAGAASLMVAKSYKIAERLAAARPDRLQDKDAGDILRLMMTAKPGAVAASFEALIVEERVATVAVQGLEYLRKLFGGARTPGVEMAVRALGGDVPETRVRALAPAFVSRLPVPLSAV